MPSELVSVRSVAGSVGHVAAHTSAPRRADTAVARCEESRAAAIKTVCRLWKAGAVTEVDYITTGCVSAILAERDVWERRRGRARWGKCARVTARGVGGTSGR